MQTLNPAALEELRQLQEEGDHSLTIELIDVFVSSAQDRVRDIGSFVSAGDAEKASKAAHNFKSGARTLGAEKLGALCEELETKPGVARSKELESQIKAEASVVCAELLKIKSSLS